MDFLAQTRRWLTQMGLTVNEQKTRVCSGRTEPFTFLGYTFGPLHYRKDGHGYLGAAPAKQAVQRLKVPSQGTKRFPRERVFGELGVFQLGRLSKTSFATGSAEKGLGQPT
jgi:hypothetical protein